MRVTNPVLMLVIALPAAAVFASFASLAIILGHPDTELPEQYHWEGFQLDRDFSRSERATSLGVRASLNEIARKGECNIDLRVSGAPPEHLSLTLAHATVAALDQHIDFHRDSGRGIYVGRCTAISEGHWRLELTDGERSWSVRDSVKGFPDHLIVDATTTDDD